MWLAVVCTLAGERSPQQDFRLRGWDTEDGLPAGRITDLARTPDGYLWIGSEAGLVRFDGTRFVVLTTNTVPALGDNHISSLLVDANGILWVGTLGGTLAARANGVFSAIPLDERLRGGLISSLTSGPDGALWLATAGHGVARWRSGVCEFPLPTNGLPASPMANFVTERDGRMWAQFRNVLMSPVNGSWQEERFNLEPNIRVYAVAPARRNEGLWVAVSAPHFLPRRGARIFLAQQGQFIKELDPYPWAQDSKRCVVTALLQDAKGRVWVGTLRSGVFVWEESLGWRQLNGQGVLSSNWIRGFREDEDGLIWAYSSAGELFRIAEQKVATIWLPETARDNVITTTCVRRDGSIWVGTDEAGVFRYEAGGLVPVTNGLGSPQIGCLFEDSRSNLWVGTWRGLYTWTGNRFRPVLGTRESSMVVLSLCEDRQGNLWGTSDPGGVFRRSPEGSIRYYSRDAGLDHFYLRGLAEDSEGRICVAVSERGLYRLVGDRFEKFLSDQWPGASKIRAVHADPEGGLWIATSGEGLFLFKGGRFRRWGLADGLPDIFLDCIVPDDSGNLWFGSNRGIFGCSKQALEQYEPGSGSPVLFWRLTMADGLPDKSIFGAGQPTTSHAPDGRLWFPNQQAVAGFEPVEVSEKGRILMPLFEEAKVDGVACKPDDNGDLRIRSGARRLEFHYTCPDLVAPERMHFLYRLDGSDTEWREGLGQRVAYYGQLAPGNYEFRLKAGGDAGEWRETARPVRITIEPRLWERWPVRAGGAMMLIGAVALTVWRVARARARRRLALLEAQHATEAERRRIARDLHDDVGGDLTEIMLLGEQAAQPETPADMVRSQARVIARRSQQIAAAMDEIVWTVNPRNDSVPRFADHVAEFAHRLFDTLPSELRVEIEEHLPAIPLQAAERHSLFLAVKEAMNNAARHSAATEVRVDLQCENGRLVLTVQDNGRGFDPGQLSGSRNGLENMRQRMEGIGGTFQLKASPGQGTQVRIAFPLPALSAARKA